MADLSYPAQWSPLFDLESSLNPIRVYGSMRSANEVFDEWENPIRLPREVLELFMECSLVDQTILRLAQAFLCRQGRHCIRVAPGGVMEADVGNCGGVVISRCDVSPGHMPCALRLGQSPGFSSILCVSGIVAHNQSCSTCVPDFLE